MSSVDRPITEKAANTRRAILEATRRTLLADGYARMSTRGVAEAAGVPLSQLHYHFGSKQQLMLELLEAEDARRLARQSAMYAADMPLWQRYEQACDFLEDDLESGYVRVLQEMIAAGWSDPVVGERVRALLLGWVGLLSDVIGEAEARYGAVTPFTAQELSALVSMAFMGGEAMLLLGFGRQDWPLRSALRRVALVIRMWESDARA